MTNEFSNDPIKLRIVDLKNGTWKQTYVFVGQVPADVERDLRKLEKNISTNSAALKKFYGAGWRAKLGIAALVKTGGSFEIDDDLLKDLEDLDLGEAKDITKGNKTKDVKDGKKPPCANQAENANQTNDSNPNQEDTNQEDNSNQEDNNNPNQEDNQEDDNQEENQEETQDDSEKKQSNEVELITEEDLKQTMTVDFLTEKEATLDVVYAGGVQFITDIAVSPSDNILEFKHKIYATIGIPIYRQHLWFKYRDRSYPMNYVFSMHKNIEAIDIERLLAFYKDNKSVAGISSVEGIPVEIEYYNNKDFVNISARDSFELLRNIYYKSATSEYFLVDLNDLIKPTELYSQLSKDKYQLELIYNGFVRIYFPMITQSVFHEYLKNERNIRESYPDLLPDKRYLYERLLLESTITTEAYDIADDAKLDKKLFSSITATTVSVTNSSQDVDVVLSLRNLFDAVVLTDTLTYCKANLLHENQNVILRKSYLNEREPKDIIPINSILLKIKTNADTNENMRLILFKNGNYVVKTDWREENHMDFKKITKAVGEKVNPIIKMINKYGERVKFHKIDLVEVKTDNVAFTETSMSFYYDDDTTEAKFSVFKQVLEDFRKVSIITSKDNSLFGLEFFFNKGMYKYDASRIEKSISVDNYYEFLSNGMVKQKWESVFVRTRLFQVLNISSKLKITISGLRDDVEMEYFYTYMKALLAIYNRSSAHIKVLSSETIQTKTKKALKNLKIQDPVLYDFKKIYKSNVIYSKICQKPYQPVILSDEEYSKLPKDKKSKALKYWNFTKQKPVWYSCPNMKYPFIKFIVKQHPRDFCIPCCKKIEMSENVNQKKQEIHNTCLTAHEYTGEKVNLTKGSHYIASYGKNIESGRISRLPENTLEPLFFDTYSPEGGIDQECVTADGYYLFGVDQHTNMIKDVGMLHIIAHSLNSNVSDFLADAALKIKKNPDKFRVILDGNAGLYFKDVNDLVASLVEINEEDGLIRSELEAVPWNNLLVSIVYYYFGINVIMFDDQQKELIDLILPKGLKTHEEMFPDTHKNLVVLRKKTKYYPIYLFNTEIFKRTGIIDTKLFLNESGLITIIKAIVRRYFETQDSEKIKDHVDLTTIREFGKSNGIDVTHYYINYSNLCYAVVLDYKGKSAYFPIAASHYTLEKKIDLIFTPYAGEYNASYSDMSALLKSFYKWNVEKSEAAGLDGIYLYPKIEVQQWLSVRESDKVIGFSHNNTNYFVKELNESAATKFEDKPVQMLLYHPYEINKLIYSVKQGTVKTAHLPTHEDKLNASLYNFYLYNIVLMHFINVFNSQRNTTIRTKMATILAKTDLNKDLTKLRKFIDELEDQEDIHKFKTILSRYFTIHHDKKQLILDIKNAYFNFDKVGLESLRGKTPKAISAELHKLAAKFVKIGKPKLGRFPNMFVACDSSERLGYCDQSKLIIEKDKLNQVIDILAADMATPTKWKWLFNSMFVTRTVNFFRFIRRKNETVTIEFLEN